MAENKIISIDIINPNLRYINLYQCSKGFDSGVRKLYDYYFLYVHAGIGVFIINGENYQAVSGDLFFVSPNVENQIIADYRDPFILTGINFDFTDEFIACDDVYPVNREMFEETHIAENISFSDFCGFKEKLSLSHDEKLRQVILDMIHVFESKKKYCKVQVNSLLKMFIAKVVEYTSQQEFDSSTVCIQDDILDYLSRHYHRDITNEEIANEFHYHPDYISRMVYSYTGLTIRQYIIDLRIRKAISLLLGTDLSIADIADAVGLCNVNYFSKLFKSKTGYSPALFRNNITP